MIDELLAHIDRLIVQRPVSKDALEAYRELVALMKGVEPKSQSMVIQDRFSHMKKEEGFPLFPRDDLPLDFETSSNLLKKFMGHLSNTERNDRAGLKKALEKSSADPAWCEQLFKILLMNDDKVLTGMAKEVDLDPKVLEFLARVAMKPSLHALRHSLAEKIEKKGWNYGYCPLCGSQPNMAYFGKTGTRYLHCELCGEEWAYLRLRCPFCENRDQNSLGYFESDQEEGFRVDICRKCQRYIKSIDERVFEELAPLDLEFLATIHLDILANKHGFN